MSPKDSVQSRKGEGKQPGPLRGPEILDVGRRVLRTELKALEQLADELGDAFVQAVELLSSRAGRVIVTGMGKSGIISHKIAATLASTGTPSLFLHPAEAVHGDLGMITPADTVLAISNSGETDEILELLPVLELMKVPVVAICSRTASTLGRFAQVVLRLPVEEEGCPIGLAPMASTTASLALGDALAGALMEKRGFKASDFALFHPRGTLGRRLLTRVRDLMIPLAEVAVARPDQTMRETLRAMISKNQGAVLILGDASPEPARRAGEEKGRGKPSGLPLAGIFTDGDLKRLIDRVADFGTVTVGEVMTRTPMVCGPEILAERALRMMEDRPGGQVTVLPVVDGDLAAVGLIRLHDILKAKIK